MLKLIQTSIVLLLFFSSLIYSQGSTLYEFESAYAEKTTETNTSGIIIKKSEKIFVNDGGNLVRREIEQEQTIPQLNQTINSRSISITDKEYIITWDPETNTGTRMKNPLADAFQNMTEEQAQQFGQDMADAMNTEITEAGTGEVAGVTCNITIAVTNMMGMEITTTTWTYKNFLMKSESEGAVTSNEVVTLFNEGADNDPDLFIPDDNVTITDIISPLGN